MGEYQLEQITAADERMGEVIRLGDLARRTIGLLPRAAFFEAASRGGLLVALKSERVIAYALYGLPRNEITLTHLVVSEGFQRQSLARTLVEKIAELHPERSGIRASCREDYGLSEMWSGVGFYPRSEKVGRGADRAKVIVWYRPNANHVDLFTGDFEPLIRAAIDFDVLRDLCDKPIRRGAEESLALTEDHLLEKLQLLATPQLYRYVSNTSQTYQRQLYLSSLDQKCTKPHCDRRQADSFAQRVAGGVDVNSLRGRDGQARQEQIRHIGEAAACGADVFITLDDDLISAYGAVSDNELGIRLLRPADVVVRIDELSKAEVYRPTDVYGTSFKSEKVVAGIRDELSIFQNVADREAMTDFLSTLRSAALQPSHWDRNLIRDTLGRPVLLTVSGAVSNRFEVPLFRVDGRHPVSPTLIQHALFEFRRLSRQSGSLLLAITDHYLPSQVRRAAILDGFTEADGALVALVVDTIASASEVFARARQAAALAHIDIDFGPPSELSRFAAAEIERVLWPAKIIDSNLPSLIIPVRPEFSSMLFGVPAPLPLFRKDEWGLEREHVYYRTPGNLRLSAPTRLLWYKSQGRERSEAAVFGCSLLQEVVVGAPEFLHSKFSRLGVWNLEDIRRAAREGRAQALRFTQTEIFRNPLSGKRLRDAFAQGGFTGTVQGPRKVLPPLFASIYREGTSAH